jgi:hypothetical protein
VSNTAATPDGRRDRVRVLNDNFRSTFVGGRVLMTQTVIELPVDTRARLILAVQSFAAFTQDNDPHGEHDFGLIEDGDVLCFWKIDYYDTDMELMSPDPADASVTTRVLTVMLAEEY